jgi:dipeptidyl aminopeptidase/acylaminoacyl peptidase
MCACAAVALWLPGVPAAAATFTMREVLSAPFVSNLAVSGDGNDLVWEVHLRGLRNLYVSSGGGAPRKITAYGDDDGLDFEDVAFLPDKSAIVYLRGGTSDNSGGENINPLALVPAPPRGIYVVPIGGGAPTMVGTGRAPRVAPHTGAIAWIDAGTLTIAMPRPGGGYDTPKTVPVRGHADNPAWSPDGTRIAFTNARDDHAFVAMYTPATKGLVYATPDFAYDDDAAWSPDGASVAFVRQPGSREDESPYSDPSRFPWSIMVADATSGAAHQAWQAHRGMGAQFYPSDSAAELWWLDGATIAFPWEGSGWQNLYAVRSGGGVAMPLATGPFEAETIVRSFDGSALLYATNEGDVDHRHIWRVGLDAKPAALTSGAENQWSPVSMAQNRFAYVNAGYNTVPTVYSSGTPPVALVGEPTPADFPANDLVAPQLVTFHAKDGLLIHAQLFVPKDGRAKHPGLIFDHGGPVRQMLPGFHYMEAYTNLYESNQYYANHGFVVLSINYRSGIMYGHDFRMAKRTGALGGSEYQDVLAGAHYLQSRSDVDPTRLGIYGLSYGGYLTALALARNSDIFKAGVDYAGVHNWASIVDLSMGRPVGTVGTAAQRQVAYDASPIASLSTWVSPVFISQGDDDRNVEFSQGMDLVTRLRDRGVDVQTMVFPNETHENQVWGHMVALYDAAAAFLIAKLKP